MVNNRHPIYSGRGGGVWHRTAESLRHLGGSTQLKVGRWPAPAVRVASVASGAQVRLTALAMTLGAIRESLGPSGVGDGIDADSADLVRGIHPGCRGGRLCCPGIRAMN